MKRWREGDKLEHTRVRTAESTLCVSGKNDLHSSFMQCKMLVMIEFNGITGQKDVKMFKKQRKENQTTHTAHTHTYKTTK